VARRRPATRRSTGRTDILGSRWPRRALPACAARPWRRGSSGRASARPGGARGPHPTAASRGGLGPDYPQVRPQPPTLSTVSTPTIHSLPPSPGRPTPHPGRLGIRGTPWGVVPCARGTVCGAVTSGRPLDTRRRAPSPLVRARAPARAVPGPGSDSTPALAQHAEPKSLATPGHRSGKAGLVVAAEVVVVPCPVRGRPATPLGGRERARGTRVAVMTLRTGQATERRAAGGSRPPSAAAACGRAGG
jgi:hypothetical protein